jgi:hypothetical protein
VEAGQRGVVVSEGVTSAAEEIVLEYEANADVWEADAEREKEEKERKEKEEREKRERERTRRQQVQASRAGSNAEAGPSRVGESAELEGARTRDRSAVVAEVAGADQTPSRRETRSSAAEREPVGTREEQVPPCRMCRLKGRRCFRSGAKACEYCEVQHQSCTLSPGYGTRGELRAVPLGASFDKLGEGKTRVTRRSSRGGSKASLRKSMRVESETEEDELSEEEVRPRKRARHVSPVHDVVSYARIFREILEGLGAMLREFEERAEQGKAKGKGKGKAREE